MPSRTMTTLEKRYYNYWPAARVRNFVRHLASARHVTPPPRMARDRAIEWMAETIGVTTDTMKAMNPLDFGIHHLQGHRVALINMIGQRDYADMVYNENLLAQRHASPPAIEVPVTTDVYHLPVPANSSQHSFDDADADESPTAAEAAETLAGMLTRLNAADAAADDDETNWDDIKTKRKEEYEIRQFLSDRLVAVELKMGLLDRGSSVSQNGTLSLMGRIVAIMGKLCEMDE